MRERKEREKPSSLVLERQREALVKGVEVASERRRDDASLQTTGAEAEPASPAVGRWGAEPLDLTPAKHEELATKAEAALRRLLVTDNYDSVSNFVSLFEAFEKSTDKLYDVYEQYSPPIRPKKHTCVGLGFELIKRWRGLNKEFPGFAAATALISCEEAVVDVREYVTCGESPSAVLEAEKEHVMVGVQIKIDGRPGLMLADPGYHVPRIVTVMADRAYPHTGWFTQSDEPHCRKEYNYMLNPQNTSYVEWQERETRGTEVKCQTSLVYAARPYLDGVNVTERRNLVYNFRSLLSRDQKGHLIAGLYFPVGGRGKDAQFTLFFDNGTEKRKTKYKFSLFLDPDNIPDPIKEEIELCNAQMNYKEGELRTIICQLAKVLSNQEFIDQMLEINDDICRLSL
ncbi:uncharacterized protein LOC106138810 [Amyelois transitella]|uniref:uncharacterized protein LOC106138810 n=1 Tax=Amyelois transitella TaxID=680683 RepID=UPI00298F7D39|nr:uncharacterized protein LOC106138810 [Amyelois transitella]